MQTCFDVSTPCLDVPFPGMRLIPTVTSSALLPWPVGLVLGWPSEPAQSKPTKRSNCFNLEETDTFRSQKGKKVSASHCLDSIFYAHKDKVRIRLLFIFLHWFMTLPWERLPKVQSCTGLNAFYCHGLKKQQQLTLHSVYIVYHACG